MRSSRLRSSRCQRCCIAPLDQPRIVPCDMGVFVTDPLGYRKLFSKSSNRRLAVHAAVFCHLCQTSDEGVLSQHRFTKPVAFQPRELNRWLGCSKKLTEGTVQPRS
jgi:hypothetical protein